MHMCRCDHIEVNNSRANVAATFVPEVQYYAICHLHILMNLDLYTTI